MQLWRVASYVELTASAQWMCRQRRWLLRITSWSAEGVEPGEKITLRKFALGQFRQGGCRGNRLLLHPQVDLDVAMGGGELGVAQPCSDGGDVDSGFEKVHSCCMPN